jgi:predicted transcriptional regulator
MQYDQPRRRSPLGLGPLETAIMQVVWDADTWLTIGDIRNRMDYPQVAYTTVSKIISILVEKDLLTRRPADRAGRRGPPAWWYRAARPVNEHIGELIAVLLDYSRDPEAALDHALTVRRRQPKTQPLPQGQRDHHRTAHVHEPQGRRL